MPALSRHLLSLLLIAAAAFPAAGADDIVFNRDIRPILADKCFHCHGPDAKGRKADLRLDKRDGAVAAAIVPGKAADSELIARILHGDPDEVMPPPATKKSISAKEADLLKRWIDEGAVYQDHWAFLPIAKAEPPTTSDPWAKNPIDQFVLAELAKPKLKPSPEADARVLIRRMSIDLTGLLPDPARVEAFAAAHARDADAAVKLLARELLASPHYGERWGRHWLDQARYADSNGYSIDGERSQWPYRDWVIRAINEDLPFDRFTIEQIAGDLLPNAAKPQRVATGFHRNTLINQEGGTDAEQFRNEEMVDRVNTTGAVWLGLTVGCAQCHTHKFDPISHQEYFELFAFFNQGADVNNTGATVEVSEGELLLAKADPARISTLESAQKTLADLDRSKAQRQAAWEKETLARKSAGPETKWSPLKPSKATSADVAKLSLLDDGSVLASKGGPREIYTVLLDAPKAAVAALRLRVLPHESLPSQGPGWAGTGNFMLTQVDIRHGGVRVPVAGVQADHAPTDAMVENVVDDRPGTGWSLHTVKYPAPAGKLNAPHEVHFTLAEPIPADGRPIEVLLYHELNDYYNVGRFAVDVSPTVPATLNGGKLLAVLSIDPAKRSAADKKYLTAEFDKADVMRLKVLAGIGAAKKALGFGETVKTMVMSEVATPRETFIHLRGDFLRHDKETGALKAGVPAVFPALPGNPANPNRLDFAKWLVRPDHPLTPRVAVNRVWMRYFGKGLVETENDFGTQGSYPTHPELLDWLAGQFVARGWSMKALHELIVTSAAYRQSSVARADLAAADPLNRLLGRQNRLRFDAEIVRDAALSASGLLTPKIGGPGVTPPQPEGVYAFTQRKVNWVAAEGPDRYRRALYTRFYRSAPYPLMTTFDSPDFQSVCTSRARSNTPLQSLTLANDASMFEMAQGLGARLMREVSGTDSAANRERIRHAWALSFSRNPSDGEVETLAAYQELQARRFQADEAAAVEVAPKDRPKDFPAAAAASWTAVARALMNTDEFITRE